MLSDIPRCPPFEGAVTYSPSHLCRWTASGHSASTKVICKTSWQTIPRMWRESDMLSQSKCFGVAQHLCSYPLCHNSGEPVCNSIFLPKADDVEASYWHAYPESAITPPEPEHRYSMLTLSTPEGRSLVTARSSLELCEALIHGVLGMIIIISLCTVFALKIARLARHISVRVFASGYQYRKRSSASGTHNHAPV